MGKVQGRIFVVIRCLKEESEDAVRLYGACTSKYMGIRQA